jgi:hypothetical protein
VTEIAILPARMNNLPARDLDAFTQRVCQHVGFIFCDLPRIISSRISDSMGT